MDRLRRPLFIIALILIAVALLIEIGSSAIRGELDPVRFRQIADEQLRETVDDDDDRRDMIDQIVEDLESGKDTKPPGMAIAYMALLDTLVVYSMFLIALSIWLPERLHGRLQGIATLIVSLLILIAAIFLILEALVKLLIMVALFMAVPFGTIAYMALYGFFNRPGASIALSSIMFFKLLFAGFLIFAHQRFLQNKGLVLIILISLVTTWLIGFLHALVPIFLVSITDAVGAIIAGILAAIFAIFFLVGSIISVVKAIL